jgi:hypothetical protein
MTTSATPPVARAHHAPEALYAIGAALTVLAANAAVMGTWWTSTHGTGSDELALLAGGAVVLLLLGAGALVLRHPLARRAAIGALACAVVVDAMIVGYELSGATLLTL